MTRIFELKQLRAKALADGRQYVEQAEKENREMSAEENASFQKAIDDIKKLDDRISKLEAVSSADDSEGEPSVDVASRSRGMQIEKRTLSEADFHASKEYRSAWLKAVVQGDVAGANRELRTVNFTSNANGVYAVTPTQLVSDVVVALNNICWVRQFATKYTTTSPTARIPLLTTRMGAAAYGATEITAVTADTSQSFSTRDIAPLVLSCLVKMSKLSINCSNLEQLVASEIAYAMAVTQENKFLTGAGAGSNEPLGMFTASSSGISTGRDVSTGSQTDLLADSIFTAKYKLKQQYINQNTRWVFHRDSMSKIAKLKASDAGTYLFAAGLNGGSDTLVNIPILLSEYAPSTYTTGLYVGLLGDMSQYAIVDVDPVLEVQRLVELYAATHEVGLIATSFNTGAPQLEEAFARLKTD